MKKQQSIWADFIERDYLDGEFKQLIKDGIINGATSNPAIFKDAILNSDAYKEQIIELTNLSAKQKYEKIAIFDIQKAADILRPLYDNGNDGFVSIEVDPNFSNDANATIEEGISLFERINRPNVMIKIPATKAGYEAMEELVSKSIPVNATLIFSKEQAIECANAFNKGMKKSNKTIQTVISVFVSRFDRALDEKLDGLNLDTGLVGIYNAADIYNSIESLNYDGIRVLFASTGVKGDKYPPSYYIDKLVANNSVNTAPVSTIKAFVENKDSSVKLPIEQSKIDQFFNTLKDNQIDLDSLRNQLLNDGLSAFEIAFSEIIDSLK